MPNAVVPSSQLGRYAMKNKSAYGKLKDSERTGSISVAFIIIGVFLGFSVGILILILSGSFMHALIFYLGVSVTVPIISIGWWYLKNSQEFNGLSTNPKGKILILSGEGCDVLDNLDLLPETSFYLTDKYDARIDDNLFQKMYQYYYDFIFVDIDFLESAGVSMATYIDELRKFRSKKPGTSLILLSREFIKDNSELHRIEICDASLKLPISPQRLLSAMREASENNLIWCQRQKDRL